jgi:hypothetical protein
MKWDYRILVFYCNCNLLPFSNNKDFLDLSTPFLIAGHGAIHIHYNTFTQSLHIHSHSNYTYVPIVITHTFPQSIHVFNCNHIIQNI